MLSYVGARTQPEVRLLASAEVVRARLDTPGTTQVAKKNHLTPEPSRFAGRGVCCGCLLTSRNSQMRSRRWKIRAIFSVYV